MQEIRNYGIKIYQFPDAEGDEDDSQANRKLKVCCYDYYMSSHGIVFRRGYRLLLSVAAAQLRLVVRKYEGVCIHGAWQRWTALITVTLLCYVTC